LLVLAAEHGQNPGRAGVGLEHLERGGPAFLSQFLDHHQSVQQRRSAASETLRQADAQQPQRAEIPALVVREGLACGVPGLGTGCVPLAGDLPGHIGEFAQLAVRMPSGFHCVSSPAPHVFSSA